jgi:3-oxoacyl-[acyl-carrier-protein] synthase III
LNSRERRYSAVITAAEHYVPDKVLDNHELEKLVETSDAWIRDRTGIAERRILEGKPTSFMGIEVARKLLASGGIGPEDVDLIIVATITPDMMLPATACIVQEGIGAKGAWAFDMSAACTGFVYAVTVGAQFIENGAHRRVLVIGADKMSAITDYQDRSTCVLFGDGAGGVLLERGEDLDYGLRDFELHSDGAGCDELYMKGGGSLNPATHETVDQRLHYIRQEGRSVFKFAVTRMTEVSQSLLQRNGLSVEDLKLFVPHQANMRIISATAQRLGLPLEKVMVNIERYANTTAGTVPIALSEAHKQGRLERGDWLLLTGVGGGLTWGSALFRWAL